MFNKTSATLMLQTIMVLMEKQNSTDVTVSFNEDMELERCYESYGCFSKAYPWTENRPDNYLPETPQSMRIRLIARIQNMADALLNLEGNEAATVLIVDWRGGSQPPYGQAVANIRLVGAMTAHLVHNIYVSSFITLTRF
ncbi:hypothetical protein MSG28_007595 [Choristoneura fumiferana]|uniref:Uncharacterized protein n=1 Tax=Choristoneura fumiferana TaxID=7141 RepID=A0ACC0JYE7_CHOFU|nr:hypothetical protein MSG28_007595 [Choristoneura fumiferana]